MSSEPFSDKEGCRPVALHERAMEDLSFIRDAMARSVPFTAVSGWGTVGMGCVAAAGAYIAALRLSRDWWINAWTVVAVVGFATGFTAMILKARRTKTSVLRGAGRRFALSLFPPILAGAVLTEVYYETRLMGLMPFTWLLLYGVAVVTGGAFSVRVVPLMGVCFMVLGSAAAVATLYGFDPVLFGPMSLTDLCLALGFGGFHIVFGAVVARRYGG